jgi:dsRNA-specific ribonuclease
MKRSLLIIYDYYSFETYFSEVKFKSVKSLIHVFLNYLYLNSRDDIPSFLNTIFTVPPIDWDIDWDIICNFDDNYKNQLMIHYQRNFRDKFPVYGLHSHKKSETGAHIFHAFVYSPLKKDIWGEGFGYKKKTAEQKAAKASMVRLELLSE